MTLATIQAHPAALIMMSISGRKALPKEMIADVINAFITSSFIATVLHLLPHFRQIDFLPYSFSCYRRYCCH